MNVNEYTVHWHSLQSFLHVLSLLTTAKVILHSSESSLLNHSVWESFPWSMWWWVLTKVHLSHLWDIYYKNTHFHNNTRVNWGWSPQPIQLRTSKERIGEETKYPICRISVELTQQSTVIWTWFLTELSVIQIRGRWKERTREAQRVMPAGWLKGELCSGWLTHEHTDLLEV